MGISGLMRHGLRKDEVKLLAELRSKRDLRHEFKAPKDKADFTVGQKIADQVAATMGSWSFIIIQSLILVVWIVLNLTAYIRHWDPYPFILLNLALSFQAAYAAPFIMMSQNRQQAVDRQEASNDYRVNIKAELEIELLHEKIDQLRDKEVLNLTDAIHRLTVLLQQKQITVEPDQAPAKP